MNIKMSDWINYGSARNPLGIDLGSSCIKAVQLRKSGRSARITGIYRMDIPREKAGRPSLELTAETLKRLVDENKIQADRIVSSFPLSLAIVRNTVVPFRDTRKINQVIKFQAEPHIPFPIEEVVVDFHALGAAEEDKMPVIIVGAKKDLIAKHLEIFKESGLDPETVDIDAFALFNNYLVRVGETAEGSVALLDIGATKTLLVLIKDRKILLVRSINVGGDHITEALQKELGIDFKAAEELKKEKASAIKKDGLTGEEEAICKAISPILNRLNREVDRSIRSISATLKGAAISKIYLSGGGVMLKDTVEFFAKELGCEAEYLCHLSPIEGSDTDEVMSGMSIATGLALQGLDLGEKTIYLRREEYSYVGTLMKAKRRTILAAVLVACVIGLLAFNFGRSFIQKRGEYTQLKQQLEQIYRETFPEGKKVKAASVVSTMRQKLKDYQRDYESFSGLSEKAISSLEILRDISERMPKEIKAQVTDISISQDTVEMEGLINNPGDADKVRTRLAASTYFSKVEVPSTSQEDTKYKFKLEASIKK